MINVISIRFIDKMLFSLTTLQIYKIESGEAKNKTLE